MKTLKLVLSVGGGSTEKNKDEEFAKAICDGTSYKYNRLYSTEAVNMPIRFKLFGVGNPSIKIKNDNGIERRFVLEQFNSQFKDEFETDYENLQFKKDRGFSENLITTYRNALLWLVAQYSNQYWIEKKLKDYPDEWNSERRDNLEENHQFASWFNENFEIGVECWGGVY